MVWWRCPHRVELARLHEGNTMLEMILDNAKQRRDHVEKLLAYLENVSKITNVNQTQYVQFTKFVAKKLIEIDSAIQKHSTEPDQLSQILIAIDKDIWAHMPPEDGTALAILR
jgi:hypothetical protein